ncbi:AraC family transcriptional regulator [Enterobacter kobei]|uniref:AraC family transcriptional regulator n=1 Tax=Enterobacter kobei TaxID=208224 RepID=UPI003F570D17
MLKQNKHFSEDVFNFILEYIDKRLPFSVSMDELQLKSGYSKRHLSRLFQRYVSVTPSLYIKIMQAYKILIELKFTTITVEEICQKYNILDIKNFRKNMVLITGLDPEVSRVRGDIHFGDILKKHKMHLPVRYLSCKFVSLFDFSTQARGTKYTLPRAGQAMMTSHYQLVEDIMQDFCEKNAFRRDEVWMCAKFSPFDSENYEFTVCPCITGNPSNFPGGEDISLQGDYLCFTWTGKPEDTFPRLRSFYDVFFLKYQATRKEGYDILRREKIEGVSNYYVFTYFIPVAINEAILAATTG